ncbi:MAG: restriction endonuclease [Dehalococcoidia bacterium]
MALWLVRAGSRGEYEKKFLDEKRIYLTWHDLSYDLSKSKDPKALNALLLKVHPDEKLNTVKNWTSQVWQFVKEMKSGDWVVMPSKMKPAIHFAEITGDYQFVPKGPDPYYHFREIKWLAKDIPRSNFDQDLLYSFGAFKTICQISRNDAEKRIRDMGRKKWKAPASISTDIPKTGEESELVSDLEQLAKDEIAKHITRKFKGHAMARLVEAVLQAQGYTTYRSPEGPDKGIDLLAAPGPLGFGSPRLCVQVKSTDVPVDTSTLNQLIGSMQNVNAEQGLLVSWGGFKSSVDKEIPNQFFRVRLWDQNSLIQEIMNNYDRLDEDIKTELPLKQIWTMSIPEAE